MTKIKRSPFDPSKLGLCVQCQLAEVPKPEGICQACLDEFIAGQHRRRDADARLLTVGSANYAN